MAKRYIEANALIQDIEQSKANNNHNNSIAYQTHNAEHKKFIKMVLEQPTADVVEVKRGHWIEDEVCVYACSECGFTFTSAEDISEFKYCRCGADMRGEEK